MYRVELKFLRFNPGNPDIDGSSFALGNVALAPYFRDLVLLDEQFTLEYTFTDRRVTFEWQTVPYGDRSPSSYIHFELEYLVDTPNIVYVRYLHDSNPVYLNGAGATIRFQAGKSNVPRVLCRGGIADDSVSCFCFLPPLSYVSCYSECLYHSHPALTIRLQLPTTLPIRIPSTIGILPTTSSRPRKLVGLTVSLHVSHQSSYSLTGTVIFPYCPLMSAAAGRTLIIDTATGGGFTMLG